MAYAVEFEKISHILLPTDFGTSLERNRAYGQMETKTSALQLISQPRGCRFRTAGNWSGERSTACVHPWFQAVPPLESPRAVLAQPARAENRLGRSSRLGLYGRWMPGRRGTGRGKGTWWRKEGSEEGWWAHGQPVELCTKHRLVPARRSPSWQTSWATGTWVRAQGVYSMAPSSLLFSSGRFPPRVLPLASCVWFSGHLQKLPQLCPEGPLQDVQPPLFWLGGLLGVQQGLEGIHGFVETVASTSFSTG